MASKKTVRKRVKAERFLEHSIDTNHNKDNLLKRYVLELEHYFDNHFNPFYALK